MGRGAKAALGAAVVANAAAAVWLAVSVRAALPPAVHCDAIAVNGPSCGAPPYPGLGAAILIGAGWMALNVGACAVWLVAGRGVGRRIRRVVWSAVLVANLALAAWLLLAVHHVLHPGPVPCRAQTVPWPACPVPPRPGLTTALTAGLTWSALLAALTLTCLTWSAWSTPVRPRRPAP
jgi:hypothetical protein